VGPKHSKATREILREEYAKGIPCSILSTRFNIPASTIKDWRRTERWPRLALAESLSLVDGGMPSAEAARLSDLERALASARASAAKWHALHGAVTRQYDDLARASGIARQAGQPEITKIHQRVPGEDGPTEAIVTMVASDWHVEEIVERDTVNGLNEYNPDIAKERAGRFFRGGQRLLSIIERDVNASTLVLALLGDFITNELHEDSVESNAMPPVQAIILAQDLLASGIAFLVDNFKGRIIIPCHSGNHGRTTKHVHSALEHGHSLEYFMYHSLANAFKGEPRVEFLIAQAYHSYVDYFGSLVRFHHGHSIKYHGGVGGLYIPTNKAIAQWNRAMPVSLDVFGHYHTQKDGGNFLSNGSLIGYNGYALRGKFDYEPPKQTLFAVDNKHGRTFCNPIYVR